MDCSIFKRQTRTLRRKSRRQLQKEELESLLASADVNDKERDGLAPDPIDLETNDFDQNDSPMISKDFAEMISIDDVITRNELKELQSGKENYTPATDRSTAPKTNLNLPKKQRQTEQ